MAFVQRMRGVWDEYPLNIPIGAEHCVDKIFDCIQAHRSIILCFEQQDRSLYACTVFGFKDRPA